MDPCFKFKEGGNIVYRTHTYYLEFEYNVVNPVDVLLATQCSFDRMALLEELSKHWPGVISIALYLTDTEVQSFLDFVRNSPDLRHRKNIAYHIVYKEGVKIFLNNCDLSLLYISFYFSSEFILKFIL
jgi:glycosyltransferase-like protein LARGE